LRRGHRKQTLSDAQHTKGDRAGLAPCRLWGRGPRWPSPGVMRCSSQRGVTRTASSQLPVRASNYCLSPREAGSRPEPGRAVKAEFGPSPSIHKKSAGMSPCRRPNGQAKGGLVHLHRLGVGAKLTIICHKRAAFGEVRFVSDHQASFTRPKAKREPQGSRQNTPDQPFMARSACGCAS